MRTVHKFEYYLTLEDAIADYAVEHRRKYAEAPAIGCHLQALYDAWHRLGRPPVRGGKGEPVAFDTLTFAGVTTLFEDRACTNLQEFSVEVPDE